MDGCQFGDEPLGTVESEDADGVMGFQTQLDEHFGHFMDPVAVFPGIEEIKIDEYIQII